jgi:ELWxxDGT repeat protein
MSQRQRRAKLSRRRWHSRATRNLSAAAVATSAALAVCGGADAAGAMASPVSGAAADTGSVAGSVPGATQVASVTPVTGVKPTISAPISLHGELFYGTAATGGGKLWESDGTPAGTKLIKQIKGRSDAAPTELTNVGGHLWFEADGELWKSSGTAASTVAVDIHVDPTALVDAGKTVFIETATGLWRSDGTPRTTTELKAIKLGKDPDLAAASGRVYFSHPTPTSRFQNADLWTSNGTAAGTKAVRQASFSHANKSLPAGPFLFSPDDLTTIKGHLFFIADVELVSGNSDDGEVGYSDLWEATGTSAKKIEPYGVDLTNVGGSLYFFDYDKPMNCVELDPMYQPGCGPSYTNTYSSGFALWDGTTPLFDFSPNTFGGTGPHHQYPPYTGQLTAVGSTLFFAANLGGPTQLWREDGGTEAGLANVGPLAPHNLVNVSGTLFFTGQEGTNPKQVYESNGEAPAQNGTDAGTFAVTSFPATTTTPGDLVNLGGSLFFTANDGSSTGYGLWTLTP